MTAGVPGGSLNCGVMIGNETRRRNWPDKESQHCAGDGDCSLGLGRLLAVLYKASDRTRSLI